MTEFVLFSGRKVLHSTPIGVESAGICFTINETTRVGFEVVDFDSEADYVITVGDFPVSDDDRKIHRDRVEWDEKTNYLDGASGYTVVSLADRKTGTVLASVNIIVEPTKLSSSAYEQMVYDLGQISAELLLDLLAKSRKSVAHNFFAKNKGIVPLTTRLELNQIMSFWRRFSVTLTAILDEPNTRIQLVPVVRQISHWDRVDHRVMRTLVQRGWSPRSAVQGRMFHKLQTPRVTHDTVENRVLTSFLKLLLRQVSRCVARIEEERDECINEIEQFKQTDWPVYNFIKHRNRPRINILEARIDAVDDLIRQMRSMIHRHMVKAKRLTKEELIMSLETQVFLNDSRYSLAARQMRSFIKKTGVVLQVGEDEGAKTNARIYEQWVYFQICAALRASGLSCISHNSIFEPIRRDRFSVDIDRNAALTFESAYGQLVRLRYEPTIFPLSVAQGTDSLYRGLSEKPAEGSKRSPWTPDIVMEILEPVEHTRDYRLSYAVVFDAKYTTKELSHGKIEDIHKYLEIKSVETGRQIVRQLWVAAPVDPSIDLSDDSISWSKDGEVSAPTTDLIQGVLGVDPGNVDDTKSILVAYILGTLKHARRYFRDSTFGSSTSTGMSSNHQAAPAGWDQSQ